MTGLSDIGAERRFNRDAHYSAGVQQCLRFGYFVVVILLVTTFCAIAACGQTASNPDQAVRAREFINRFGDSPCLSNQQCQSWMTERHVSVWDVARTLEQVNQLVADAERSQESIKNLQDQRQQLQQEDDSLREQIVEKALEVLRAHNFGFPGNNPTDVLRTQLQDESARVRCGNQEIIFTLFGYFEYEHDIDLSKGAKFLKLTFTPFVFGHGGTFGQQIDAYNSNAQLSIQPELMVAATSINIEPIDQTEKRLDLRGPLNWSWKLQQARFSSVEDTLGELVITVASPDQSARPSLPLKIKGKPWWSPFAWLWEKKAEVWPFVLVAIIFIGTWIRKKSFGKACAWLWTFLKHAVGKLETG